MGNTCPPDSVNIALTPRSLATATASAPPCPSSFACRPVSVVSVMIPLHRLAQTVPGSPGPVWRPMLAPRVAIQEGAGVAEGSTYPVWGWGLPGEEPGAEALAALGPAVRSMLGFDAQAPERPASLAELPVPRPRPPAALAAIASDAAPDRARHGLGRSYRDLIRGLRGRIDHPPDLVLRPRDQGEVAAVLDWCGDAGVAVVPFGGGTSVVGGVEPDVGDGWAGAVSLDLGQLAGVVEVDPCTRAARVLAGTLGPALEEGLRPHGLTLRFFPQSFQRSTIGGWLATRAAGHYATGPTHVDDLVESITMVTPVGVQRSRRLPGSGAGPSPDRLALGSEGTLGVITEAWLRVVPRPLHRAGALLAFDGFEAAAAAVRRLVQAGLAPASCRVLDATEAALAGTLAPGGAGAGLRVGQPPGRRRAGARRGAVRRRRRPGAGAGRAGRRRLALQLPAGSLPARPAGAAGGAGGDLRDRLYLGAAGRAGRRRARGGRRGAAGRLRRRPGRLPADPRLSRRGGAVLHRAGAGAARQRAGAVGGREGGGGRDGAGRRRYHHPPPRRRPRSPALVRPPAARAVRARPAGGQGSRRSGRRPEPGGAAGQRSRHRRRERGRDSAGEMR